MKYIYNIYENTIPSFHTLKQGYQTRLLISPCGTKATCDTKSVSQVNFK